MKLDGKSSELCTFSTPFGYYKFNRLPFGLTNAPELFQRANYDNFGDIKGVSIYFDDLLIAGVNEKDHDEILGKVMTRAKNLNVKFNPNKLQYKVADAKFLGHNFNKKGIQLSEDKVRAIEVLEHPNNKKELQRILGMAEYLRRFVPDMAEVTSPLRELLKKDVLWTWLPKHETALEELKRKIKSAPILRNYNKNLPLIIQADASQNGLGCSALQEGLPIAFGSRRLTDTERRYAQVEKELLGIVFSLEKFHYYAYGREVTIQTDHKPLVALMEKELNKIISPRLVRMRLKLLRYDVKLTYIPGKSMHIADLLSRAYIKDKVKDDPEMIESVHAVTNVTISDTRLEALRKETELDKVTTLIKEQMENDWRNVEGLRKTDNLITKEVRKYYVFRHNLSIKDELLYLDHKIIIPQSQRKIILDQLHAGHAGITKTKQRARELMYWPGMSVDIEDYIKRCKACEKYSRANIKEPMVNHELPDLPFEKIASDICEWGGKIYLITVDYYSRWFEMQEMVDKRGISVVRNWKKIFATHGIPKLIIADNMPYSSSEVLNFAKEWGIIIRTSSPHYPKSNGLAERTVGIAKDMLKKCIELGQEWELALIEHRNSPLVGIGLSPAQLLMSRRTRSKVPSDTELLTPKITKLDQESRIKAQEKSKEYYDRGAKARKEFSGGDNVVIRKDKKWEPGEIIMKHNTPRSYWVKDEKGEVVRRNSYHLKETKHKQIPRKQQVQDEINEEEEKEKRQMKYTEDEIAVEETGNTYVTRYGRKINRPIKYKDFVE